MILNSIPLFILFVISLAFIFDFINGFHDAANSTATIVATGVLKPYWAVIWVAFFNFIAFLFFQLKVASTIGIGLIQPDVIDPFVIFSALSGAIIWNLITWYYGLPSSSSHALIGGLVGAALAKSGTDVLIWDGFTKVLVSIILSPVIGFILAAVLAFILNKFFPEPLSATAKRWFGRLQFLTAALFSLGHGGNDAQKTMGIIAVLLFSTHQLGNQFHVPLWVVISCNFVMGLGTLVGGWRIVNTLGRNITELTTMSGCCAETAAATTLFLATDFGIPVSTTHTITGAIAGVGTQRGALAIHWEVLKNIAWAWILTIPCAGILAGAFIWVRHILI